MMCIRSLFRRTDVKSVELGYAKVKCLDVQQWEDLNSCVDVDYAFLHRYRKYGCSSTSIRAQYIKSYLVTLEIFRKKTLLP